MEMSGASAHPDDDQEDNYETLLVNSLPVTVVKGGHAKSILTEYCQQNKLACPNFSVRLENPDDLEWKLFKASFKLNNKLAIGSGKSAKLAEKAAARKYLNNNFMSGEISPQTGIPVSNSKMKKTPAQTRKENRRAEKFYQRKKEEAERNGKEREEEDKSRNEAKLDMQPVVVDVIKKIDIRVLVGFDLERAAGHDLTEIIQMGWCSKLGEGISNIIPKCKICPVAARLSHKIVFNGTDLTRQGKVLPSVGMKEAADMLIAFLREVKSECGAKPILVCYGGDIVTLLNNFAAVAKDVELVESISGSVNFVTVIEDDENYPEDSTKSLTKITKSKPNLPETVLGSEFDKNMNDEAHDALFDSKLLMRVVEKYCSVSLPIDLLADTYLIESDKLIPKVKSKVNKGMRKKQGQFHTFNGWNVE